MKRVWVLGAGGMLGSAIWRVLQQQLADLYLYHEKFEWSNSEKLRKQFHEAVRGFLTGLTSRDEWEIYWAAGIGTMGSSISDLDDEITAIRTFLAVISDQIINCNAAGVIGYASSAGALYAGSMDYEITEASVAVPVNDYAKAKQRQELLLMDFVSTVPGLRLLIARFSTLYGPGQAFGKRQGLLSHIARCALRCQPIEIFVPLDTSRDYLFVDDAASRFLLSSRGCRDQDEKSIVKIIAAERSITISEIISIFNQLLKKRLRIVCSRSKLSQLYAPRVSYRSLKSHLGSIENNKFTLLEGAQVLLQAERMAYIANL